MSPGPTFDRVYVAIKEQLIGGSFAPGDHLEPTALGEQLFSSITPVRDALHRLVGERLVEAPRHDGFRVPAPTEAELRDLYHWSQLLVEIGCRWKGARSSEVPDVEADQAPGIAAFLQRIAMRTGSFEYETAIDQLNSRLGAMRRIESLMFSDQVEELEELQSAFACGNMTTLRRRFGAYHRRRQHSAPQLLASAHRRAQR